LNLEFGCKSSDIRDFPNFHRKTLGAFLAKPGTISFHTFGCRLNQAETAALQNSFERQGWEVVEDTSNSEVVVVNTCTVTANGDADTRRLVNRVRRKHPDARIALVGCQAQVQADTLSEMDNVAWVVGNDRKMELPEIIGTNDNAVVADAISTEPFVVETAAVDRRHTRANLKMQDGCDFFCLFCVIPYARGRARSRVFDDLIREAGELVDAGHHELVLTGVNIGTYDHEGRGFAEVIDGLLAVPNLSRLRISSIEPTTIPERILDHMTGETPLCRYLHIPIQSGCDETLFAMNRRYSIEEYSEFLMLAHDRVPQIGLGTDVIVGYPGETDAHFDTTYDTLRALPYAYFHVFSYSERDMAKGRKVHTEKVDPQTIASRSKALRELSERKRRIFMETHLGQEAVVLFEQCRDGWWDGLTDNFVRVRVRSDKNLENVMAPVHLEAISGPAMTAKLI
jgi:threonylcarbamoyladenosine tRNA methylthiotransferase MtaB